MVETAYRTHNGVVTQCNSCAHAKVCRYAGAMEKYHNMVLTIHDEYQEMKNFTTNITCNKYQSIIG